MQQWIEAAITEARKSTMNSKHGCIGIDPKTGHILSRGFNVFDSRGFKFDNTIKRRLVPDKIYGVHAEASAIFRTPRSYRYGLILVVIKINNQGQLSNSKPCKHCERIINKYKITVYYST